MHGHMYGVKDPAWLYLFIIIGIFCLLIYLFNTVIRNVLKVEKKPLFSPNYVNATHRKIHIALLSLALITLLITFVMTISSHIPDRILIYMPTITLFSFIILSEIVRVIMEKKYAKNKRDWLFTLSQLLFISTFIIVLFLTNFFGLIY